MFVSLLATFGLSLLLQQVLNLFYGPEVQTIDMKMGAYDAFDYMVSIPYSKVLSLILAAIITICVVIFMKRSRMGQAIRATAQDPRAARVLGIDTDRVYAFTFAFNAALCGAAGVLVSIIWGNTTILWNNVFSKIICNCNCCWFRKFTRSYKCGLWNWTF